MIKFFVKRSLVFIGFFMNVILMPYNQVYSQTLKLNFEAKSIDKGELEKLNNLKIGEQYHIEVNHINLGLYQIIINEGQVQEPSDPPSIFEILGQFPFSTLQNLVNIPLTEAGKTSTEDQPSSNENSILLLENKDLAIFDQKNPIEKGTTSLSNISHLIPQNTIIQTELERVTLLQKPLKSDYQFLKDIIDNLNSRRKQIQIPENVLLFRLFWLDIQLAHNLEEIINKEPLADSTDPLFKQLKTFTERRKNILDDSNYETETKKLVPVGSPFLKVQMDFFDFNQTLFSTKSAFDDYAIDILDDIRTYSLEEVSPSLSGNYESELIQKAKKLREEVRSLSIRADKIYLQYLESIAAPGFVKPAEAAFKEADKQVADYYKGITQVLAKMDTTVSPEAIKKVLETLVQIRNSKTSYKSLPRQYTGDPVGIKIDIKPRDSNSSLSSYSTKFVFPNHYYHPYTGISSGVFVTRLTDDFFSVQAVEDSFIIVGEGTSGYDYGVNALMHMNFPFNKSHSLGGHIAFGPAMTISNRLQLRAAISAGFTFGREPAVVLDFGAMFGNRSVLSSRFNTSDKYQMQPEEIYISKFATNWFISLGYFFWANQKRKVSFNQAVTDLKQEKTETKDEKSDKKD